MMQHRKFPATQIGKRPERGLACLAWLSLLSISVIGCGRIISQKATDQLIAGDAVDRTVSQIDFRILMGKKVFLDTQYINKTIPGVGFVTSEYMISSIRQKMMCDGCLLQEKSDEADFVVEMRIGALGADGHEVVYGMPPNNYLSLAASVVTAPPAAAAAIPSMPELSVGKRDDQMAAAKIALFAYNRRTRDPIWQSGISESRSLVADRWYFGAGPFHKGNIYGSKKQNDPSLFGGGDDEEPSKQEYFVERRFTDPSKSLADNPPAAKPAVAAATPTAGAAVVNAAPATAGTAAAAAATTASSIPATAAAQPTAASVAKAATPTPDPNKTTAAVAPAAAAPAAATATTTATVTPPAAANPPAPTKTTAVPTPTSTTPVAGPAIPPTGPAATAPQAVSSSTP